MRELCKMGLKEPGSKKRKRIIPDPQIKSKGHVNRSLFLR